MPDTSAPGTRGDVIANLLRKRGRDPGEVNQDIIAGQWRLLERGGLLGDDLGDAMRILVEELAQELIGSLSLALVRVERGWREGADVDADDHLGLRANGDGEDVAVRRVIGQGWDQFRGGIDELLVRVRAQAIDAAPDRLVAQSTFLDQVAADLLEALVAVARPVEPACAARSKVSRTGAAIRTSASRTTVSGIAQPGQA